MVHIKRTGQIVKNAKKFVQAESPSQTELIIPTWGQPNSKKGTDSVTRLGSHDTRTEQPGNQKSGHPLEKKAQGRIQLGLESMCSPSPVLKNPKHGLTRKGGPPGGRTKWTCFCRCKTTGIAQDEYRGKTRTLPGLELVDGERLKGEAQREGTRIRKYCRKPSKSPGQSRS